MEFGISTPLTSNAVFFKCRVMLFPGNIPDRKNIVFFGRPDIFNVSSWIKQRIQLRKEHPGVKDSLHRSFHFVSKTVPSPNSANGSVTIRFSMVICVYALDWLRGLCGAA